MTLRHARSHCTFLNMALGFFEPKILRAVIGLLWAKTAPPKSVTGAGLKGWSKVLTAPRGLWRAPIEQKCSDESSWKWHDLVSPREDRP